MEESTPDSIGPHGPQRGSTSRVIACMACIAAVWALAFGSGFLAEDWRGTEPRRVQIAAEMLESGSWMVPRLYGEPTLTKPPLFYWVEAMVFGTLGITPQTARLPAMFSWLAVAWLAFWLVRSMSRSGPRSGPSSEPNLGVGLLAGAAVLCAPALLYDAPTAEIDPFFAALTSASVLCLARSASLAPLRGQGLERVQRRAWRWLMVAGVLGGLALLSKGPPYLLFIVGPLLVYWRHVIRGGVHDSGRQLLWRFALPCVLPVVAYYTCLMVWYVDAASVLRVMTDESVGRLHTWKWASLVKWPLSVLAVFSVLLPTGFWLFWEHRSARSARPSAADRATRVLLASSLGGIALFLFFPAQPTRYLLPAVAPAVVAAVPSLWHYACSARRSGPLIGVCADVLGVLGALTLLAIPWLSAPCPGNLPWFALVCAGAPWLTTTRRAVVVGILALPVVAAWTAFPLRHDWAMATGRVRAMAREPLLAELERMRESAVASVIAPPDRVVGGAAAQAGTASHSMIHTVAHWDPIYLFDTVWEQCGAERSRRSPDVWTYLLEDPGDDHEDAAVDSEGFRDVFRLRMAKQTLVRRERVE